MNRPTRATPDANEDASGPADGKKWARPSMTRIASGTAEAGPIPSNDGADTGS
jgi:hypothetical protein